MSVGPTNKIRAADVRPGMRVYLRGVAVTVCYVDATYFGAARGRQGRDVEARAWRGPGAGPGRDVHQRVHQRAVLVLAPADPPPEPAP